MISKREAVALTRLAGQDKTLITSDDIENTIHVPYEEAKKIANDLVHKN